MFKLTPVGELLDSHIQLERLPMNTFLTKSSLLTLVMAFSVPLACKGGDQAQGETKEEPAKEAVKVAKVAEVDEVAEQAIAVAVRNPVDTKAAEKLVADAAEVVKAIGEARKAIADKDKEAATKALSKAREASDRILADRPSVDLAVELWAKDREIELVDRVVIDTIPIFAGLDRIEERVYDPEAVAARKEMRGADKKSGKLTVGDQHADIDLIDASIVYTEVDMPIASTHTHVVAAEALVKEGDLEQADRVLANAEASLEVIQVIDEAPEFKARAAIWAAEAAFAKGNMARAKSLLSAARSLLEVITKDESAGEDSRKVAQTLLDEIAPLIDVLEIGNESQASAFKKLKRGIWGFAQRAAARATLLKRKAEQRYALADALMYLERAQSEGLYDGEPAAGGALLLAEAMLKSGVEKVAPATKPIVKDLLLRTKELLKLNAKGERDAALIRALHQELKFDLRVLMYDLHL